MKSIKHHIFQTLKIIALALILTTGLSIALAWTGPTAAPPGNNKDEPLNTSNNWQTKYGYLSLPKLIDSNDGQTDYYLDPGANSWLYRLYSYDIRSSIFYDQDNTDYYVDPASTSKMNRVDASIVYDRDNTAYYSNPASTSYYNDMRANIYYDKGNTGYYVDPASTSKFNTINLGGESRSSWHQIIWFGNVGVPLKDGAHAEGDDASYVTGSYCTAYPASAAKIENGKVYTKVYFPGTTGCNRYCGCCDSGWVEGTSASCDCRHGSVHCHNSATTSKTGVNGHPWQ